MTSWKPHDRHRLTNVPAELILHAVRTFPVQPGYLSLKMLMEGFESVKAYKGREEEYLALCKDQETAPYSELRLNKKDGKNKPYFSASLRPVEGISLESKMLASQAIIQGNKAHEIQVTSSVRRGLTHFRDSFLDPLLERGYRLDSGNFIFGQYWVGYGRTARQKLLGFSFSNASMDLTLPDDTFKTHKAKLIPWFEDFSDQL